MSASILLETERLTMRELTVDDAAFILRLLNEPAWLQHIGDRGVRSLEAAQGYILDRFVGTYRKHGFGPWLVERKSDNSSIGICGLLQRDTLPDVDLGFAFLSEFRGPAVMPPRRRRRRWLTESMFGVWSGSSPSFRRATRIPSACSGNSAFASSK